jgi:hypothetical protein
MVKVKVWREMVKIKILKIKLMQLLSTLKIGCLQFHNLIRTKVNCMKFFSSLKISCLQLLAILVYWPGVRILIVRLGNITQGLRYYVPFLLCTLSFC